MQKERRWMGLGLLFALPLIATSAMAAATQPLNVSQTPSVYAQKGIAPNLFLLLDDSGSMQFEYLGSRMVNVENGYDIADIDYAFPTGSSHPYGSNNYCYASSSGYYCGSIYGTYQKVPGFDENDGYAEQLRSAYLNPNYYDPAVTYTPWACASKYPETGNAGDDQPVNPLTGTNDCVWNAGMGIWTMKNADVNKAYLNPARPDEGHRSINVWNDSGDQTNATDNNGFAGAWGGGSRGTLWYHRKNEGQKCFPHDAGYFHCYGTISFWPATYFNYFGDRPGSSSEYRNHGNYERVQICPATLTANSNGHEGECDDPDPLPGNPQPHHTYLDGSDYVYIKGDGTEIRRSRAEALQNFANWYQYYRSHVLATQAGIGIAFMQIPTSFRVDYGVINTMDGNRNGAEIKSTEDFTGNFRLQFLEKLYQQEIPAQGTPNRRALKNVGRWFAKDPGNYAPWGNSAAEAENSNSPLSCRANYVLLATDGEWSGGSPGLGNVDNEDGPTITDGAGHTGGYVKSHPYQDGYSNTLADVAMYYWEHDLQSDMTNNIPTNATDSAFWQHMVTFTVGLGVEPSLVENYMKHHDVDKKAAQQAVFAKLASGDESWPSATSHKIDDTWHAAVDGHGTYASAASPTELYEAISEALINIVNRTGAASSLSVNTEKTGATRTRQQVYQALFHPQNWWGDVLALPVMATPANGTAGTPASVAIADQADWSASCVLTGGQCDQTGSPVTRQQPSSRDIFTWDGSAKAFTSTALSPSALSILGGAKVVNYIRGMRNKEAGNGGNLRKRDSVLGDVVSSSPVYVARPDKHYADSWANFLYPGATLPENGASEKYSDFVAAHQNRAPAVYAGANDGMLHGFYAPGAASSAVPGKYPGEELLAYVPKAVYANLGNYANPAYTHHYFVNATPGTGDLFDGGQWRTWLVGGEGAGGKSIFALDITNPATFDTGDVIGEWGPGNMTCANVADCGEDLGLTFGKPVITRFNSGQWGFVFGNGFNSESGVASIFIGLISGDNVTFYELKTGYGPDKDPAGDHRPDGIAFVTPADLNGDHTADYVYAGDYFGNVWRFDLTAQSAGSWHASTYAGGGPLFSAVNAHGSAQPITTKLLVLSVPGVSAGPRVMIEFGTGASLTDAQQAPNTTDAGVQSLYGVWDWKFDHWNSLTTAAGVSAFQYDTLSSAPAYARNRLKQQSITVEQTTNTIQGGTVNNRVITQDPVCWADIDSAQLPAGCSAANQYGWYLDLVSPTEGNEGEKVVYSPVLRNGVFLVNTIIPSSSSGLTCQAAALTGWTMAFDPENGGRLPFEVFDTRGNGRFDTITLPDGTKVATSGITLGAVGSPGFVTYGGDTWMVVNTGSGKPTTARLNLPSENLAVQLSWQELR